MNSLKHKGHTSPIGNVQVGDQIGTIAGEFWILEFRDDVTAYAVRRHNGILTHLFGDIKVVPFDAIRSKSQEKLSLSQFMSHVIKIPHA